MQEVRVINGHEYTFEITENELLARELCKQQFDGYKLAHETSFYTTKIYKVFGAEKKQIGLLEYDYNRSKFVLWKFINKNKHELKKTKEFGVNGALFSKLRAGDYIYFKVDKEVFKIRVEKAIKVGNYKNFKYSGYNSELQFFIPVETLREIKAKEKQPA